MFKTVFSLFRGSVAVAGDELEDVMLKFVEGEYDVLVATTIIESGLDISNANTMIINKAVVFFTKYRTAIPIAAPASVPKMR